MLLSEREREREELTKCTSREILRSEVTCCLYIIYRRFSRKRLPKRFRPSRESSDITRPFLMAIRPTIANQYNHTNSQGILCGRNYFNASPRNQTSKYFHCSLVSLKKKNLSTFQWQSYRGKPQQKRNTHTHIRKLARNKKINVNKRKKTGRNYRIGLICCFRTEIEAER